MELIKGNDPLLKETCPEFNFETGYTMEDGTVIMAKKLYELLALKKKLLEERSKKEAQLSKQQPMTPEEKMKFYKEQA